MRYDSLDPDWDFEDYRNIFWDYLNYSYIRSDWNIMMEWK